MESIHLNKSFSSIKIPYSDAPSQADLKPGESIRLYGNIFLKNDTNEEIHARVRFDLRHGFFLTVDGITIDRSVESHVSMNTHYTVGGAEDWMIDIEK